MVWSAIVIRSILGDLGRKPTTRSFVAFEMLMETGLEWHMERGQLLVQQITGTNGPGW